MIDRPETCKDCIFLEPSCEENSTCHYLGWRVAQKRKACPIGRLRPKEGIYNEQNN